MPHSAFGGGHRAAVKAAWGGLPPVDHTMAVARWERGSVGPCEAAVALQDSAEERRLREAVKIFAGLGALAAARITGQKMRQLGIRSIPAGPRFATRAHPLGLTRVSGRHST